MADPQESENRAGYAPSSVAMLGTELGGMLATARPPRSASGSARIAPALRERLRALGYVDGAPE